MIYFSKPAFIGNEKRYLQEAINNQQLSGDGSFTKKCHIWFEQYTQTKKALLTTSCTHALEMAAILLDVKTGDEIIMPSYTFVSTANAFALRGAKIVFVDIQPGTMNMDETKIEQAITKKTKVIVPVHYAGVACEMDTIMKLAKKYNLFVVEDAAQAITSTYKGKALGTIGDLGTYSFHDTKNITSGEGGLLLINNEKFIERAEIIREKGTNRSQYFRGLSDKYSWQDLGSSYLPSELNAAILLAQLENITKIQKKRFYIWDRYFKSLRKIKNIELPEIPINCEHNAHIFYIKCQNLKERSALIKYLQSNDIYAVFHYIPLHSSPAGQKFGIMKEKDIYTSKESERILRLPLHYNISTRDITKVIRTIKDFYHV